MAVYSINDIEKLTGVKAHTLRIWEKRYDVLPNRRTDTNIRYYLDEDLQLILNIAMLNKNGLKISKIAQLSGHEVKQMIANLCEVDTEFEDQLDGLMLSIFELNEFKFLKILEHEISTKGFELTMEETIFPLLDKLGMMWIAGSIKGVHENFINNIIKKKLIVEIDKLKFNNKETDTKFLLYLPESQNHEMSLLYVSFILKKYGANILYLGTNLSFLDLIEAIHVFQPSYIFSILNDDSEDINFQHYINDLGKEAINSKVLLMGYQLVKHNFILPSNAQVINKIEQVKTYI